MKPVSATTATIPRRRASPPGSLWILDPSRDLMLFILPPLLIIPLILVLQRAIPPETLGLYILGLGGFGHHLPGFIRAYSDPELFRRYRFRFTVVPALLIAVCALYAFLDLNALVLATVLWGTWHGAMQINGFARIYDSKAGSIAPLTARLDALMCVSWFGLAILSSPAKQFTLVTQYYLSGGPLIPPTLFHFAWWAWGAATAVVTVLFAANAWRHWKAGTPQNPVKFLVLGVSFAFWWYCMSWTSSIILGVLMWEIFHDVQYNALVWRFQRQRVDGDLGPARLERALFSPGWKRLAVYVGLILLYGTIGVHASFADINAPEKSLMGGEGPQWLLRLTLASALLHFYFDGFIWRIRQRETRQGLGLDAGTRASAQAASPAVRQASLGRQDLWWLLFLLPVAYLGWSQFKHKGPGFEAQVVNLSQALPGSWISHFLAGTYYKGLGRLGEAEEQYRLVTVHNPDWAQGHVFLGDLLSRRGALREAAGHFERALALDSTDEAASRNLAFLYLGLERPVAATGLFNALLRSHPDDAELHYGAAAALLKTGRYADARGHAERVLELAPGHSGALNYLGLVSQMQGDRETALRYYRDALAADPNNGSARRNLDDLSDPVP